MALPPCTLCAVLGASGRDALPAAALGTAAFAAALP